MADKIKTDASLPDVSASDVKEAQTQGIQDAIAESAAARFKATDGVAQNDDGPVKIVPTNDALHLAYLLEMEPGALTKELKGDGDGPIPDFGKVASLLEMERSGKNRTDVVEVLCKHLGVKSPYEVTNAGPGYTNEVSRTVLKR